MTLTFCPQAIAEQLDVDDVDGNGAINLDDMRFFVKQVVGTSFGDSNLDGLFNSGDLVDVFRNGEYEDQLAGNSVWSEGDWNSDGEFDSSDFVVALGRWRFLCKQHRSCPRAERRVGHTTNHLGARPSETPELTQSDEPPELKGVSPCPLRLYACVSNTSLSFSVPIKKRGAPL